MYAQVQASACEGGHIPILQWLSEQPRMYQADADASIYIAIGNGQLGVLQWLRAQDPPYSWGVDGHLYSIVAEGGHLEALQWLHTETCPGFMSVLTSTVGMSFQAARHGHIPILHWLRQHPNCYWGVDTCRAAALGGSLEVLKWLSALDPPCPWDRETCRAAAYQNHTTVMQWAREQGCPE
jgi:hypothetical protein